MADEHKSVFISYRRKPAWAIARLVYHDLLEHGYDPFLDVKSLGSGKFDVNLLRQIESRRHFVIILTLRTVERCIDSDDPLRKEIEHAIDTDRNIVPLLMYGFSFNGTEKYLTGKLEQLHEYNGWPLTQHSFESDMQTVRERFLKQPFYPVTRNGLADEQPAIQSPPTKEELRAEEYINSSIRKETSGNVEGAIEDYARAIQLNPQFIAANEAYVLHKYAKEVETALYEILHSALRQVSSLSGLSSSFENYTKLVQLAAKPVNQTLFQKSVEGLDQGLKKYADESSQEFSIQRDNWEIVKTSSIALLTIAKVKSQEDKEALLYLKIQLQGMLSQIEPILPSIKSYSDTLGKLNENRQNLHPSVEKVQMTLDEQHEIYLIGNAYLLRIINLIERKLSM